MVSALRAVAFLRTATRAICVLAFPALGAARPSAGWAPAAMGPSSPSVPPPASTDDYGDAPAATLAGHLFVVPAEVLGTAVTSEAGTVVPSWYGDAGDDGVVAVAALFPGSAAAVIVVTASAPGPVFPTCGVWVDQNATAGWGAADALPPIVGPVGPAGAIFVFGPFPHAATAPASPFVRIRLTTDPGGLPGPVGLVLSGEVEDFVLPGTGGPATMGSPGGGGPDAGDAPLPYPPCNSTFIVSERLGVLVTPDALCPAGFPVAGTAAFDDDAADDGIVRIDGLLPGGSCTIVVQASNPFGTFLDTIGGWIDFDGDGTWDETGEVFAPVAFPVGPVPATVTLGPLAVPFAAATPFPTRLKLSFGAQGAAAAGVGFTFGEVEDYLLPEQLCTGCNTTGGSAPSLFAVDPPRVGGALTLETIGAAPLAPVITVFGLFAGPGADLSGLGVPIAPGVCFLCVLPGNVFVGGVTDASGALTQVMAVPPAPAFAGLFVALQNFQIFPSGPAGLDVVNTNALTTNVLP